MNDHDEQVQEKTSGGRFLRGVWLGNYGWLLVALVVTFFLGPLLADVKYGVRIADLVAIFVVIAAIAAVTDDRRHMYTLAVMAFASVIPQLIDPHVESTITGMFANLAAVGFLGYILLVILRDVFGTTKVSIDTLVGSICGYLLLAAIFAAIYSTLVIFDPKAFVIDSSLGINPEDIHFQGIHFGILTYYSVITLTTVGYGDVIPGTTVARGFVSVEAVLGQVYLTIIVARLVGLHISSASK